MLYFLCYTSVQKMVKVIFHNMVKLCLDKYYFSFIKKENYQLFVSFFTCRKNLL
jgi:hypothetical protein